VVVVVGFGLAEVLEEGALAVEFVVEVSATAEVGGGAGAVVVVVELSAVVCSAAASSLLSPPAQAEPSESTTSAAAIVFVPISRSVPAPGDPPAHPRHGKP
jgi:hypothetical protein